MAGYVQRQLRVQQALTLTEKKPLISVTLSFYLANVECYGYLVTSDNRAHVAGPVTSSKFLGTL